MQQSHMSACLPQKLQTVDTFPTKWHSNEKAMRQQAGGGKLNRGHNFHQLSWPLSVWHHSSSWQPCWITVHVQLKDRFPSTSITFPLSITTNLRKRRYQKYMSTFSHTERPHMRWNSRTSKPDRLSFLQRSHIEIVFVFRRVSSLLSAFRADNFLLFSSSSFFYH